MKISNSKHLFHKFYLKSRSELLMGIVLGRRCMLIGHKKRYYLVGDNQHKWIWSFIVYLCHSKLVSTELSWLWWFGLCLIQPLYGVTD